jgi:hypothetical protein
MYAGVVAERRGVTVHRHWWSQQPSEPLEAKVEGWVCNEIGPLLDRLGPGFRVIPGIWRCPAGECAGHRWAAWWYGAERIETRFAAGSLLRKGCLV